jgi:hypothetical protein
MEVEPPRPCRTRHETFVQMSSALQRQQCTGGIAAAVVEKVTPCQMGVACGRTTEFMSIHLDKGGRNYNAPPEQIIVLTLLVPPHVQ